MILILPLPQTRAIRRMTQNLVPLGGSARPAGDKGGQLDAGAQIEFGQCV